MLCCLIVLLLSSCSLTRYVPENQTLLNRNKIKIDNPEVEVDDLSSYVLQSPNNYFWSIARIKLALYSSSKPDTTKWRNRWLRKVGEPPVIYDPKLTESSVENLTKAMHNKGYWNAQVDVNTKTKRRKTNVFYSILTNEPYVINDYSIYISDSLANSYVKEDDKNAIQPGELFDIDLLNAERERITRILRRRGYYNFQKEWVGFLADTTLGDNRVGVIMALQPQYTIDSVKEVIFRRKTVEDIVIYCYSGRNSQMPEADTVFMDGVTIIYDSPRHAFRANMLAEKSPFVHAHFTTNVVYSVPMKTLVASMPYNM